MPPEESEDEMSSEEGNGHSSVQEDTPTQKPKSIAEIFGQINGIGTWIMETAFVLILSIILSVTIIQLDIVTDVWNVNALTVFGLIFGFGMTLVGRSRTRLVWFHPAAGRLEVKIGGVLLIISNILSIIIFLIVGFGNASIGNYFTVMGATFGIFIAFYNLYKM